VPPVEALKNTKTFLFEIFFTSLKYKHGVPETNIEHLVTGMNHHFGQTSCPGKSRIDIH
jgi:hypothetical protein